MIPLITILIKCVCTPIGIMIVILSIILSLLTWKRIYIDIGSEVIDNIWLK